MHKPYLDTLRGLAVVLVIGLHAGLAGNGPEILHFGQRGVQLFYIVSAFTLCMSVQARGPDSSAWGAFYIRRLLRVAPMFYLALLANTALTMGGNLGENPIIATLATLTFTHGLFPQYINTTVIGGWSVGVEFCFYAIFPLIHRFLNGWHRSAVAVIVGVVACMGISAFLGQALPSQREYFQFLWLGAELPVFLMGFLAFHLREQVIERIPSSAQNAVAMGLMLLAVALVWLSLPTGNGSLYLSSLAFVPALLALSLAPGPWIVNRFSVFLGRVSYSAYLIHFFVLAGVETAIPLLSPSQLPGGFIGFVLYFVPTMAITLLLSWGAWQWIEQPGIALGRAWISRIAQARQDTAALTTIGAKLA